MLQHIWVSEIDQSCLSELIYSFMEIYIESGPGFAIQSFFYSAPYLNDRIPEILFLYVWPLSSVICLFKKTLWLISPFKQYRYNWQ